MLPENVCTVVHPVLLDVDLRIIFGSGGATIKATTHVAIKATATIERRKSIVFIPIVYRSCPVLFMVCVDYAVVIVFHAPLR